MQPLDFLLITLAAFYCAYAISGTHGPGGVFDALRQRFRAAACIVCLAPWFAALFALLLMVAPVVVYIFAAAGGAVFIWRWTGASHND